MEPHVTSAVLDTFDGIRKLRVTVKTEEGHRNYFLRVRNMQKADDFAEDVRAFAQVIAPRRGRPQKRKVEVETVGKKPAKRGGEG